MLGGGTFIAQNKILPGAYINFVSASRASDEQDRGISAIPFVLDWGPENQIFELTADTFNSKSLTTLGFLPDHAKMINFREVFKKGKTLLAYKLNSDAVKAENTFFTAKWGGVRGNDLKTVIAANVDVPANFDVKTLLGDVVVDVQTVATAADLVANEFATPKTGATLALTAGLPFTGGTNGAAITGTNYSAYLALLESYNFNTLACPGVDDTIAVVFANFVKRMRDELGVKFQLVKYKTATAPNYEGVIAIENSVADAGASADSLIYWTAGAQSGCPLSESLTNTTYDGEYTIGVNYTQTQLEGFIQAGKFAFHRVGQGVNVLTDINSLTIFTDAKGKDFSSNQTIRVLDQSGNDIAALFNTKYLGKITNNPAGRTSLWSDIVTYNQDLEKQGAIQNFDPNQLIVEQGETKTSVVAGYELEPTNCMAQLYVNVVVA
jgi:Phage tail sheath protein.